MQTGPSGYAGDFTSRDRGRSQSFSSGTCSSVCWTMGEDRDESNDRLWLKESVGRPFDIDVVVRDSKGGSFIPPTGATLGEASGKSD